MRLIHITTDLVLVSTVIAGIRRAANVDYAVDDIPNTTLKWVTSQFLMVGELTLDACIQITRQYPRKFNDDANSDRCI